MARTATTRPTTAAAVAPVVDLDAVEQLDPSNEPLNVSVEDAAYAAAGDDMSRLYDVVVHATGCPMETAPFNAESDLIPARAQRMEAYRAVQRHRMNPETGYTPPPAPCLIVRCIDCGKQARVPIKTTT